MVPVLKWGTPMFVKFKTPEGLAMVVRASRVAAFTAVDTGGSRIFLGGALNCMVAEEVDEVERRLLSQGDPADD